MNFHEHHFRNLGRARNELETFDEVPPQRIQVPLGVGVQVALEVDHHQTPARELQALRGGRLIESPLLCADRGFVEAGDLREPARVPDQPAGEQRHRLRYEGVRGTSQ